MRVNVTQNLHCSGSIYSMNHFGNLTLQDYQGDGEQSAHGVKRQVEGWLAKALIGPY